VVPQSWLSAIVALGFIALVGVALWLAATHDFTTIWTGVGPLVGVLTGAIPAYFFRVQTQQAQSERDKAQTERDKANARALAIAGAAPIETMQRARGEDPDAFSA
jgi:hypothetical protein